MYLSGRENVEMNETAGARLHSSEHIFVGALQKAGVKVTVIKADTFRLPAVLHHESLASGRLDRNRV